MKFVLLKRRLLRWLCSWLVLGPVPVAWAEGGLISVKPVVEISNQQAEIQLGDLMEMRGVSAESAEAIARVRLADAPGFGETRTFTDVGLQQVIRNHLDVITQRTGEQIALRIPSRVKVMRKTFHLRPEEVETEFKKQLQSLCDECSFEIKGLTLPLIGAKVPEGASWKINIRSEVPRGNFSLPLEVQHPDGTRRVYWMTGSISVRQKVPVLSRAAQIGERLNPEDYSLQEKDVTFATDIPARETEIVSSVVARQLAGGQIIWRSQLRREMAVKGGDPVKVFAGTEEWQITMEGVAQGGGYVGDLVRVKIPRTQKVVSGLIREKGLVEVH